MTVTLPTITSPVHDLRFALPTLPVARVLHQIRTLPEPDRTSVRESLGYSQPTVTRHVAALIDAGLVEQIDSAREPVRAGRPRALLAVDGRHLTTWGVHLGLRSTELLVADGGGRVLRARTLPFRVREHSPAETLRFVAEAVASLGRGLPAPVSLGVAFSAHVDRRGHITSPNYGWSGVDAAGTLSRLLGRPVGFCTGVSAMAGHELATTPLSRDMDGAFGSTLYFYAREVIGHAWIFNGAVHRPHSGSAPVSFRTLPGAGVPEAQEAPLLEDHPLGNTSVLKAARDLGVEAGDLAQLVRIAEHDERARGVLDDRARALGRAFTLAVDIVDPEALVFAGEAFTLDPRGVRIIVDTLRRHHTGPGELRIQRAGRGILRDAARQAALHGLWRDPLGTLAAAK